MCPLEAVIRLAACLVHVELTSNFNHQPHHSPFETLEFQGDVGAAEQVITGCRNPFLRGNLFSGSNQFGKVWQESIPIQLSGRSQV